MKCRDTLGTSLLFYIYSNASFAKTQTNEGGAKRRLHLFEVGQLL
jgi:hypothetical protein